MLRPKYLSILCSLLLLALPGCSKYIDTKRVMVQKAEAVQIQAEASGQGASQATKIVAMVTQTHTPQPAAGRTQPAADRTQPGAEKTLAAATAQAGGSLEGVWQAATTSDGALSFSVPATWKALDTPLIWQTPDGKATFGVLRFSVEPGTEPNDRLIPGKPPVKDVRIFTVRERQVYRFLIEDDPTGAMPAPTTAHYMLLRPDGQEVFDLYFSAQSGDDLNGLNDTIQTLLASIDS